MCGISGIWSQKTSPSKLKERLKVATDAIAHRGPDNDGHWFDEAMGLGFGHRRLAILDPSPQGYQPMVSPSERYVIIFNGEIYNHLTLRKELSADKWRGTSDTETILTAWEQWGPQKTLQKLYGMFSFALFDRQEKTLTLVRDRAGEKPLYYGFKEGNFLFASELKPLFAMASTPFILNQKALFSYLKYTYVPSPDSILQGIHKLKPGHWLTLSLEDLHQGRRPDSTPYWRLPKITHNGASFQENQETLENLLKEAIQDQMLSDVPLGAFLSGGIDSSLVVSIMQSLSARPIKTFSIGFDRAEFNEAHHAKAVAQHLQTDHSELYVTEKEAREVIPSLPQIYDEPFADSSQIPTFLVSKLAREHVTVSLSGDAGDELFGGYERYIFANKFHKYLNPLPQPVKQGLSLSLQCLPPALLNTMGRYIPKCPHRAGDKLHKASQMLKDTPQEFYERMMLAWIHPPMVQPHEAQNQLSPGRLSSETFLNAMMRADIHHYLPDDILAKVDRAAMATSLETRVPFLDPRIIAFSQSLPMEHKIRGGKGKQILREILYRYVPRELIDRPKQGFAVPLAEWLRGALKEWGRDLLDTLPQHPYLEASSIIATWEAHQENKMTATTRLWSLLMYLSWYETYKSRIALPNVEIATAPLGSRNDDPNRHCEPGKSQVKQSTKLPQ